MPAGVLFGLLHLVGSFADGNDVGSVLGTNWWRVVLPFAWHLVWWWLYVRYDSLAAPVLVHMAVDLSGDLASGAFHVPASVS